MYNAAPNDEGYSNKDSPLFAVRSSESGIPRREIIDRWSF